jgi:hypothetical protein
MKDLAWKEAIIAEAMQHFDQIDVLVNAEVTKEKFVPTMGQRCER